MHITLRQFEIFRAVARTGKVTAAARQLHISQPAASMALSELEKQLGHLFERHPRLGLIMNDAGRALLPKASEIIDRAREIELQFHNASAAKQGELNICASSTVGNNLLPGLLAAFRSQQPDINIAMSVSNRSDIETRLLNFETDLAVIEGSCLNPQIHAARWRENELVIICSPSHPLAGQTRVPVSMLSDQPWVIREEGSSTRELFNEILATRLEKPVVAMVLNRAEAIKQAVTDGIGITCMSAIAAEQCLQSGRLSRIEVENLPLKRHFYLLTHRQKHHTEALQAFYDFLLESNSL